MPKTTTTRWCSPRVTEACRDDRAGDDDASNAGVEEWRHDCAGDDDASNAGVEERRP
jgi:hypothetical protein